MSIPAQQNTRLHAAGYSPQFSLAKYNLLCDLSAPAFMAYFSYSNSYISFPSRKGMDHLGIFYFFERFGNQ